MKTLLLCFLICSYIFAVGQTEKLQSGDSVRVALERTVAYNELIPLRDSVIQFLKIVKSQMRKSSIGKREVLEKSKKELIEFRTRINLDIKEISLTSQNGWTHKSIERIRASTLATRHEYNRLREKLMMNGNEVTHQ